MFCALHCCITTPPPIWSQWGKSVGAGDKVLMLADGNGQFASALGVELDLTDKGLGVRSRRYALLAEDQVSAAVPSSSQLLQL